MYRLKLENIGRIKSADVKIGGLTVLTGYNDIGKSTIGKVLWCLIKTAWNAEVNFKEASTARLEEIDFEIHNLLGNIHNPLQNPFDSDDFDPYDPKIEQYKKRDEESVIRLEKSKEIIKKQLENYMHHCYAWQMRQYITKVFYNELIKMPINVYTETLTQGLISIYKDDTPLFNVDVFLDSLSKSTGDFTPLKKDFLDVTLLDSPLILQLAELFRDIRFKEDVSFIRRNSILEFPIYRDLVEKVLLSYEPQMGYQVHDSIFKDSISEILKEILKEMKGNLVLDENRRKLFFRKTGENHSFSLVNVASGVKAFGMLQLLIEKAFISPRHLLIVDEPESHLHPEWEIKYGELLVWLATIGVPIVVSTHSTYIMESIHKYAKKYDAQDLVNYYIGEAEQDGSGTVFEDVTDNVPELFRKNSEAMQKLLFM